MTILKCNKALIFTIMNQKVKRLIMINLLIFTSINKAHKLKSQIYNKLLLKSLNKIFLKLIIINKKKIVKNKIKNSKKNRIKRKIKIIPSTMK